MYNYSIIIPHHNIPKLLERLLYSIPIRDDLEIIIVDDNSDKEVVDFEHFPGLGRKNCKVIFDKKGGGGGYARNLGLKEATGKWILFADADDYFNYCINDILNEFVDTENDITFFKVNSLDSDDYSMSDRGNDRINYYIDHFKENVEKYTFLLKFKCGEPWAKIIKKKVIDINHITFEESIIHNDHRFGYMTGYHAHTIGVDKRALYCVTTRKSSVSKNTSNEAILTRIRIFGEAEKFIRSHNIPTYVIWNWHFKQLAELYSNEQCIFHKGCDILLSLGFDKTEINKRLFFAINSLKYECKKKSSISIRCISKYRSFTNRYPSYI